MDWLILIAAGFLFAASVAVFFTRKEVVRTEIVMDEDIVRRLFKEQAIQYFMSQLSKEVYLQYANVYVGSTEVADNIRETTKQFMGVEWDQNVRNVVDRAKQTVNDRVDSEEFIDEVINRINRKQLG